MAYLHSICTVTSRQVGCECMVGVDTVFGVRQCGKSTLCLVFDGELRKLGQRPNRGLWLHGMKSTCVNG